MDTLSEKRKRGKLKYDHGVCIFLDRKNGEYRLSLNLQTWANWKGGHSGQYGTRKSKDKRLQCCLYREANTTDRTKSLL